MAVKSQNTLLDIAKALGGVQPILVDALTNENAGALFRALPMRQVSGWVDKFDRKTGRPSVSFRALGEAVAKSKSRKEAWQEGIFLLSGASEVDKVTADRDPRGVNELRAEEDAAYLEAMGYALSLQAFYGSNKLDGGFDGLFKRLPSTCDTFETAGGSAEKTSIYALKLGPKRFMGIYNPGVNGEIIETNDYGAVITKDSNGALIENYTSFFNAAMGISQYHPLSIGRLGKIDSTHKPTVALMNSLFAKMKWANGPDLLVTTMTGAGYLGELKMSVLKMGIGDKTYDVQISDYNGIPILIDPTLSDAEDGITV